MLLRGSSRRRIARITLMLAVMLAIAAQSLVTVVGELHEFTAQVGSGHTHAAGQHLTHDEEGPAGLGSHAADEGSLHGLLHHSHCTQGAWIAGIAPAPLVFSPIMLPLLPERAGRLPAFTPSTPFRPPIAA